MRNTFQSFRSFYLESTYFKVRKNGSSQSEPNDVDRRGRSSYTSIYFPFAINKSENP